MTLPPELKYYKGNWLPGKAAATPGRRGPEAGFFQPHPTSLSLAPFLPQSGGLSVHLLWGHLRPGLLLPLLGLRLTGLRRQAAS